MNKTIIGQDNLITELEKIFEIFKASNCEIRPHFILTGESGSGKSFTLKTLAEKLDLKFLEINSAQLTKEGTSGNSLSKALSPLLQYGNSPTIVFADEFDKLFISGNSNDSCAHESTTGVQNEFLKVLECDTASVFGDYGKYVTTPTKNCIFVFAGAFNNESNITLDRLRELGIKTEFLGRVGLVYNTKPLTLNDLYSILESSSLLDKYLTLFENVNRKDVIDTIRKHICENFEMNTLGARYVTTLINQYFIKGGKLEEGEVEKVSFSKKLSFT